MRDGTFVGREDQLRELIDLWHSAVRGSGRFVVVSGEAGIGKTVLVEHLVGEILADGRVGWGACAGTSAPPLWPWRAVLRGLGRDVPTSDDRTSSDLVDPAGTQVRRVAGLVDELRAATTDGPVLVVLDDLHRADPDSVDVLRVAVAELRRLPLLLVATIRLHDVEPGSSLRGVLTDVASSTDAIQLRGLSPEDVHRMVVSLTGREPESGVAEGVVERTAGNPFFVRELLRLLITEGSLDTVLAGGDVGVPPMVRDVLLRRAAQLSSPGQDVLAAVAVAGGDVSPAVLERAVGLGTSDLRRGVDEVAAARLVQVVDGRVRVAHDLVRAAVVEDLDAAVRRRLHLAIAGALRAVDPNVPAAMIAEHLVGALPEGSAADAAAAALEAGREALAQRAPTDAVGHLERGLAVLDASAPSALRGALLAALGDAHTQEGDRSAARDAFRAAVDVAHRNGDVDLLARGALGFAGTMGTPRTDPEVVALLEAALAALGDRQDAVVARVSARLAHALLFGEQRERRLRLAQGAVDLARATGEDRALETALYVWNIVHITSANHPQRLAVAEEFLALGRRSGNAEVEACALHSHAHAMAEGGDFARFDADVAAGESLSHRAGGATWRWTGLVHRAMRATMQGRFEEAESLGNEALEVGASSQDEVAGAVFGAHLMALRTWQGRLDELLPMIATGAGQYPELPAVWAALPFAHAELGHLDEAAEQLRRAMVDRELDDLPGTQSWTVALAMLARSAALTGQAEVARTVRRLLEPLAGRHIIGPFADCYFGPTALYTGLCAATVGDLAAGRAELEHAVNEARAVGARPIVAWATAELAAVLEREGADPVRIDQLRAWTGSELEALGMRRHLARLAHRSQPTGPNVLRRDEGGWCIEFGGRTVTVRHTKGLADVWRLLNSPGAELHVLELARESDGAAAPALGRQPVLDERAKAEYRRRVLELDGEIDDAHDCNDPVRAERAETERDIVVAELTAALGFGGRDRSLIDETERARQAVRARIRYTLDRLEKVHPEVAEHLDRTVVTGTFCCYRPERDTTWVTT